jgi:hypothetical protein
MVDQWLIVVICLCCFSCFGVYWTAAGHEQETGLARRSSGYSLYLFSGVGFLCDYWLAFTTVLQQLDRS